MTHSLRGPLLQMCTFGLIALASAGGASPKLETPLVEIKTIAPSIVVDLRYATESNVTHERLYPADMPALVRPSVAARLASAQTFLRAHGFGLKVWDAYRPRAAQDKLWQFTRTNSYVADPSAGIGSMHTRGAAVDATLVDSAGHEVKMPTEFDNFTPAAMLVYAGSDGTIRENLFMLQRAMARVGFYGLRTEWWHFCAEDWARYTPVNDVAEAMAKPTAE